MTFNYEGLTLEHIGASINWITKMSGKARWNLTSGEAAILLKMNVGEYVEIQEMAREGLSFWLRGESIIFSSKLAALIAVAENQRKVVSNIRRC